MAERVTQVALEVIQKTQVTLRVTQVAIEVIVPFTCGIGCILKDLHRRAGAPVPDVSLLTAANMQPNNACIGYVIDRAESAADAIRVLMEAYFFDACETNGTIKYVPRGLPPVSLSIPEADLGLFEDKAKISPETFGDEQDLPLECVVSYTDIELDFQSNSQLQRRNARIVTTKQQKQLSYPLIMTQQQAVNVAAAALWFEWMRRQKFDFNLWRAIYMLFDPTDVITFVYEGITFQVAILNSEIGHGFVMKLSTVNENGAIYTGYQNPGGLPMFFQPSSLTFVAPPQFMILDIPLLADGDANPGGSGFYAAVSTTLPAWRGAVLYSSSDNSDYSELDGVGQQTTYGFATTVLAAPATPWTWDNVNSLTLNLKTGSLAGVSALNVLNGANQLIVGAEIIQFQNAVQNDDGTWTVSGLLRGRRGTEWACGTHGASEIVVLVAGGPKREQLPLSQVGQLRYVRAVGAGQTADSVPVQKFTLAGNDLKPYAPCHVAGSRDMSGNLTIAWVRRTRVGGEWLDGIGTVPLSEESELYDVDIYNGSDVVRSFNSITGGPTVAYSAAEQTSDFGSPQAEISIAVYQNSASVGRGFAAAATV